MKQNKWLDDFVIEQLSIRFHKTLVHFHLESSPITNSALYHIGRRCSLLRSCRVICCPKVNNTGFLELTKKIHLNEVYLGHNVKVTDEAMEALFSSARNLQAIVLDNCPKLSDRTISCVYEALASWGRKRNTDSSSVRKSTAT